MVPEAVYHGVPKRSVSSDEFCFDWNDQVSFNATENHEPALEVAGLQMNMSYTPVLAHPFHRNG